MPMRRHIRCLAPNDCTGFAISPDVKTRTAQGGSMAHQAKSDPGGFCLLRKSDAIVNDGETNLAAIRGKADVDLFGTSMFDRVCHRLLRDSIKLIRHSRITNSDRVVSMKGTIDLEPFGHIAGELT